MSARLNRSAAVLGGFAVLTIAAAGLLLGPDAQAADAPPPDAGALRRELPPPPGAAPARLPGLRLLPAPDATLPDSAPFEVRQLQIRGNTRFDTVTLHALVADGEGRRLTLRQLEVLAARITAFYREAGYLLAQAIIPAQTVTDGVLRIEVVEARFGTVSVENRSRVASALLQDVLSALRPGDLVTQAALERSLLLLADLPGVGAGALMRPGSAVGSSDLAVRVDPGADYGGRATVNNHGNRYTGDVRVLGDVSLNNPLRRGDVLSVGVLSSGPGLNEARLAYEAALNGRGSRLSASVSALRYRLGDDAVALLARGAALARSLALIQALVRSQTFNLRAVAQIEAEDLRDRIDSTGIRNDRRVERVTLGLSGDRTDTWGGSGVSSWSLSVTRGRVGFLDEAAGAADAAGPATQGAFTRWSLLAQREQALGPSNVLALALSVQSASGNLDSSQRLSLGGPNAVRAYPSGSQSGDSGHRLSLELRQTLPALPGGWSGGRWQALAFVDGGWLRISQRPWREGPNSATLQGAGLGLTWAGPDGWRLRTSVARPIGSPPEGQERSTRAWLELTREF